MKTENSVSKWVEGKKGLSLVLAVGLMTSACVKEKVVEVEKKNLVTVDSVKMDAEELALAGEQLISGYNFMLADYVFQQSLAKDPNNFRAQFYTNFLKSLMSLKGIVTRVRPYLRETGQLSRWEDSVRKSPDSAMKSFLLSGREDISNLAGLQEVLMDFRDGIGAFRNFLRQNQDQEFKVNLNPDLLKGITLGEESRRYCYVKEADNMNGLKIIESGEVANEHFKPTKIVVECDFKNFLTRTLNSADMVALTQYYSGIYLTLTMYTGYTIEGIEKVLSQPNFEKLSSRQKQKLFESIPTLGKLHPREKLSQVVALGSDLLAALNWTVDHQNQLCPKGAGGFNQRPGRLFPDGICVTETNDQGERLTAILEAVLRGPIQADLENQDGVKVRTEVDYLAWFRNPVKDLRNVSPMTYDNNDCVTALKDKTLGGIFVQGDAEEMTLEKCK